MNLKLDLMEALKLASVLDEVVESEIFNSTSDQFQTSIVNIYNRLINLIRSDLDDKEE